MSCWLRISTRLGASTKKFILYNLNKVTYEMREKLERNQIVLRLKMKMFSGEGKQNNFA